LCPVLEVRYIIQSSCGASRRKLVRAGIEENQMLLKARFHGHGGGETTDFFSELLARYSPIARIIQGIVVAAEGGRTVPGWFDILTVLLSLSILSYCRRTNLSKSKGQAISLYLAVVCARARVFLTSSSRTCYRLIWASRGGYRARTNPGRALPLYRLHHF
jgi:hypothetical protein